MSLVSRGRWILILAAVAVSAALLPRSQSAAGDVDPVSVIVQVEPGDLDRVRAAVMGIGGRVTIDLPIINGFAASLPATARAWLSDLPGVSRVTEDSTVFLHGRRTDHDVEGPPISTLTTTVLDVDRLWRRGVTGDGVGVALIDSGVAPVGGLDADGKIVNGPDLSFDSQFENLRYLDIYGHGTHLAGIIAGADPAVGPQPDSAVVREHFAGIAPGAHIVNVKVADGLGTADVSQVIAGIQWVVAHKDDPEANIEILTLAFGTDGVQDYRIDPLAYAIERAWHSGLVVVAAAGNDGNGHALRNPASDPYVIAVGAADYGDPKRRHDDVVLDFSNCGLGDRRVDVIAPGRSVSSLRVPNSYIDSTYPDAADGERFFRGTGTSQAAAVTAGVVALMLDARPELTPDQVKALLVGTADRIRSAEGACAGRGMIDARQAATRIAPRDAGQSWAVADGSGSLEAARGSYHVYQNGVPLIGEVDVTGTLWSGGTWSGGTWSGGTWSGGTWSGGTWSGGTWSGGTWSGGTWSGGTWSGGTWSGGTWSGGTWSVSDWD